MAILEYLHVGISGDGALDLACQNYRAVMGIVMVDETSNESDDDAGRRGLGRDLKIASVAPTR